jgi:hypothetical protein
LLNAPTGEKEIATLISRDEASYRRMIIAQSDNDVLYCRDTKPFEIAYWATQYLREVEHSFPAR